MNVCIALHENEKIHGYVYAAFFMSLWIDEVLKRSQEVFE